MTKYQIAKELGNKEVITSGGAKVGKLSDAQIDENTGKIISIIVKPREDAPTKLQFPIDEYGFLIIPYDHVEAISELVIVRT